MFYCSEDDISYYKDSKMVDLSFNYENVKSTALCLQIALKNLAKKMIII